MWILAVALLLSAISSVRQTHGYPELLFANRKDIRIIDVGKETRARQVIVKQEVSFAASVDYYYGGQLVCWTDIDNERIKCVQVAGSQAASQGVKDHREVTVITRGVVSPDGLAVDWLGEKLYWTDSDTNKVEVAGLYTKHRRVLFWQDLDQPRAIALVPQKGLMFWTDWGENPKIERAGMDGDPKTRKVIINSDIHWPNGLCVDYEESVIYWADAHLSYIASADFQGKKRNKVEVQLPHPFALTYFNHTLYWTDWETNAIHFCTINATRQCEKQSKLGINLSPMYIHVYDPLRQKPYDTACQHNNGGCSHLCLASLSPRNYTCACPTGVKLIDEYNCAPGPELMLILARREDLRLISLDTPDHTAVVLPVSGVKHAIAVDYDPVDKFIYWTDDEALSIQRAKADGSEQEIIVSAEVKNPDGVAVDWVARNLYWTDTGPDRIEVARLNGTSRKIVISENLDEPRAIAVDPDGGLMFWTDWGQRPKIERAALDGSQRKVIINTGLGWPNGVAIDQDMKKVYWCDAKTDKIEESDFDGSLRRVVLNDRLPHVFGFSLLGDFLYWTDWQGRSIERLHKFTGGQRSVIVDQLPDLMGLKAVNVSYRVGNNPCATNNGGCSHLCLNRPNNNFTCGCPIGYELTTTGADCVVPEAFLLYTRKEDIRRISLLTSHNVPIPVSGIKEAIAIDFDSVDNRLYWTDISVKSISRAFMNGSQLEKVIEFGLEFPEGMAVDWLARNIYWADMGNNRIEVARLDGTSRRVLLWQNINNPHSLALNPSQGFMYWTEWGDQPRISRAQLDASKPRVIVTDMGRANGLTVDFKDNRLFWIDIDFNRIESSDLDGKNKEILVGDLPQPYSLTLYEDYVYWADWKSGSIERANKTNGLNRTKIQGDLDYIVDLLVFHSSRQSGQNPCISNNGGCSHLCLAVPQVARTQSTDSSVGNNSPGGAVIGAHTCSCPTHYKLDKDGKTCHAPTSFLLFSQKSVVSRLMEDARECPTLILPIHNIRNVKAIDYDPTDQLVYWVDGRSHSIRRAHHNGSMGNGGGGGGQVFVSNHDENIHPYDIAVEPFTRVVLWSCARNNIINVTRLDGEQVGGIIGGGDSSDQPRSLAVHPVLGLVMFINLVVPPRIEQARLDGQQRRVIISTGLDDPQALAIDHQEDLIFWADSRRIETATIHGDNRKVLVDAGIEQPVGLAVHEDFVYWVDRELNLIERVNKFSGQQREKVQGRISHLSDIIAVTPHLKQGMLSHPCHNGSECSHLCLRADRDQRCACPQGKTLASDLKTCMDLPSCEPDQFRCRSGSVPCIPLKWQCDDRPECEDKSDEENCPQKPCQPNKHRCSNNQCIEKYQVCDGMAQCDDGSDEVACCDEGKIMCVSTGVCEPMTVVCSGHCPDNRDKGVCSLVKLPIDSPGPGKAPYIVGVVASVLVLVCVVALVLYYRRRPSLLDDHELEPTPAKHLQQRQPYRVTMCGKVYHGIHGEGGMVSGGHPGMGGIGDRGVCIGAAFNNAGAGNGVSAVSGGLFERTPVTGASSSSSSMTHYPRETINPPPTPVADARPGAASSCQPLCCHVPHQGPTPAALHSYRHYKTRNRPPPPTPCSTDVQDDSDFNSSVGVFSHVTPGGCYTSPGSTYYSSPQMTDYDSDPHPPPPTPQYLNSCPPTSYPPSPSTDRSYCTRAAPCPPPPSPIASD